MNPCRNLPTALVGCIMLAALLPAAAGAAEEVDLSCVSLQVKGKTQVSERYKEYDVVLLNSCPGPVYWSMCIERIDPYDVRILEAHTPTGYIEVEQKIRVNLQVKKATEAMDFRHRFQEFYVATHFAIDPPARARCVAQECESARRDIRRQLGANLEAWEAAARSLNAQLENECPESGWGKTAEVEQCRAEIRTQSQPRLDELARRDAELREKLQLTGPPGCQLYAGELVPD